MSYSRFIEGLRLAGIDINRKMLADMAVVDPAGFANLVKAAQERPKSPADTSGVEACHFWAPSPVPIIKR